MDLSDAVEELRRAVSIKLVECAPQIAEKVVAELKDCRDLSDWDFEVDTGDFAAVASDLRQK